MFWGMTIAQLALDFAPRKTYRVSDDDALDFCASMPTLCEGAAVDEERDAWRHWLDDPDAVYFFNREDVLGLVRAELGKHLTGELRAFGVNYNGDDLDELDEESDFSHEGQEFELEAETRLGTVYGFGSFWLSAAVSLLASFAELRARGRLEVEPVKRNPARAVVDAHHRHLGSLAGDKFRLGAFARVNGERRCVGVAVVGRPGSRHLQEQGALEVTRVCVGLGARNACSKLYSAAWKRAQELGCQWLVTYTMPSEGGGSLRASGWTASTRPSKGGSWDRKGRGRRGKAKVGQKAETEGAKIRWERCAA